MRRYLVLANGNQMPLKLKYGSHKHDGVNYFHLCVNPDTKKWHEQPSNNVDQHNHMVFTIKGVEVLEITWHIKRSMHTLHVQFSALWKSSKQYYTSRIISKPIIIGVLVPIYFNMSTQLSGAPLKLHKF